MWCDNCINISDSVMWGDYDLAICRENNSEHRLIGVFNRRERGFPPSGRSSTFNFTKLGTRICHLVSSNECGMLSYLFIVT